MFHALVGILCLERKLWSTANLRRKNRRSWHEPLLRNRSSPSSTATSNLKYSKDARYTVMERRIISAAGMLREHLYTYCTTDHQLFIPASSRCKGEMGRVWTWIRIGSDIENQMVWVKEEKVRDSQSQTEGLSRLQLEKISVVQTRLMALISSGLHVDEPITFFGGYNSNSKSGHTSYLT